MTGHLTAAAAAPLGLRLVLTGMVLVFTRNLVSSDVFERQASPPDIYGSDPDQGQAVNDIFSGK